MFYLFLMLFLSSPAFAQMDGQTKLAEYERLGQEMRARAVRNAWDGVERTYASILEIGIPLTAEEHYYGAQAAQAMGNVAAARERAVWALEVEDAQEYRDWIHRIDQNYGPVSLKGDPGKVELSIETMPFDRAQAAAVQYAQQLVEETGSFEGLLPSGNYQFGQMSLKIRPGVHTERIDIRSDKYMRKLERMERKEEKEESESG